MRGRFGLLKNANGIGSKRIGSGANLASCSAFSTSSTGGSSGGGRGRGAPPPPKFNSVSGHSRDADFGDGLDNVDNLPPSGIGRGRGKPLASTSSLPSFNSFVASNQPSQQGLGRGRGGQYQHPSESLNDQDSAPKRPIFLRNDEATGARSVAQSVTAVPRQPIGEKHLPQSILNVLTGSGRGVPARRDLPKEGPKEENRHVRPRQAVSTAPGTGRGREKFEPGEGSSEVRKPKMSRSEAVKNAVGILSRGDEEQGEGGLGREVGTGRGRGRGRGRRRGPGARGRGRGRRDDLDEDNEGDDEDDDDDDVIFVGDDADGERLAKALGPEKVNYLTEAYEEMSSRVLPDPEEDEFIEAFDTNLKIELEPEYHFADFESNPDIDEKPPMPLHEALEKLKPFLMAYEGIESQEEWEKAVKETMEKVPTLKAIVDHYCGLDRVTARQQQGELERLAKTLPANVPDSVKRFTDRAVLSLQSNPGWGFDRKCQFMDKLVGEFSKAYK